MAYLERFVSTGAPFDGVKRGDLIRSINNPSTVNVVHRVELPPDGKMVIYSTRFATYLGNRFKLLHGTRARSFTLPNRRWSNWEIVQHIRSRIIDHTEEINVSLNRGFELYTEPGLELEDEGLEDD